MRHRQTKYAGTFYPSDPDSLSTQIAELLLLSKAEHLLARVLVVPGDHGLHSSQHAARAYRCLQYNCQSIKKVALITQNPKAPSDCCIFTGDDYFDSPLGPTPVNKTFYGNLVDENRVKIDDSFHRDSLVTELNLPFLQLCLVDFDLLPIVVGNRVGNEFLELLQTLLNRTDTLIVLSLVWPQELADKIIFCLDNPSEMTSEELSSLPSVLCALIQLIRAKKFSTHVLSGNDGDSGLSLAAIIG